MTTTPDSRISPTQLPRTPAQPTQSQTASADCCVNFNLPDGRVVCLSVPTGLTEADVPFVLAIVQAHVTAVARRGC